MLNKEITDHDLKQEASAIKKTTGKGHIESLDIAAERHGYKNYNDFKTQKQLRLLRIDLEEFRLEMANRGINFSVFQPTATALKKSILDAIAPVRLQYRIENFHNYVEQGKGGEHRVYKVAYFVKDQKTTATTISMYRPETKDGDPRMWISKLPSFADVGDVIAIVFYENAPHLINVSTLTDITEISYFLDSVVATEDKTAEELVKKLRERAKQGPIESEVVGDTAVGMAVEKALGILPNCDKDPDFANKIEIKAARHRIGAVRNRQTLFAQVADWGHRETKFKSSAQILSQFGYIRGEDEKLYCTISAIKPNSQGLSFRISDDDELLYEVHETEGIVAVWPAILLAKRLLQKHSETFWIKATSLKDPTGKESFELHSAIHTKKPLVSQLMRLIREGYVTMDHLIKKKGSVVSEKGPLFKINAEGFKHLFPEPVTYDLR